MAMSILFFIQTAAYAASDARFSQVNFNDMISQTIEIGHGSSNSGRFNMMDKNINRPDVNINTNKVLLAQKPTEDTIVDANRNMTANEFKSFDFSNIQTAKSSLAVMHALSEICPQLLDRNQLTAFNDGFDNKLKLMLPNVHNPKAAMRYLSTQQDYRRVLSNMKAWQMSISDAENLEVCKDILSYR